MVQLGDAALRPDEESCYVPTSYAIDADLHAWESTALVSWAMRAPPNTEAKDVAEAIRDEFRLRRGEVTVTRHHPETFLIKFEHQRHCQEAKKKGRVKRNGMEIHFVKWRSLNHALGVILLFRVRLCLDGVPGHAWTADIAEKLISKTCALESIETDLMHPAETKTIDLWAWTANPSLIPRRVWLIFTSRARDAQLATVLVSPTPPEHWQHGRKYCINVHLDEIHDYSTATVDHEGALTPTKRRMPTWHLGVRDGEEPPSRRFESFPHHPSPPSRSYIFRRDKQDKQAQEGHRSKNRVDSGQRGYNNDHPRVDLGAGRRRYDDEDEDLAGDRHHNKPRQAGHTEVYRERERSPRRRNWTGADRYHSGRRHEQVTLEHLTPLPKQHNLHTSKLTELQATFARQAASLQAAMHELLGAYGDSNSSAPKLQYLLQDYVYKAVALATQLGIGVVPSGAGNAAWSVSNPAATAAPASPVVAASHVFSRIKTALPNARTAGRTSHDMVEHALHQIELLAEGGAEGRRPASPFAMPMAGRTPTSAAMPTRQAPELTLPATARQAARQEDVLPNIADLFISPEPSVLPQPAAQQEFVATFEGPLPTDIIAALTTMFNLNDDAADDIDEALLALAGEGIAELAEATAALAVA